MKTILYICKYKAPYGGNFLASLVSLGNRMKKDGHRVLYAFPKEAQDREWFQLLKKDNETLIVSSKKKLVSDLIHWIDKYQIDIIHGHFGYLTPCRIAAIKRKNIQLVIHQHSDFSAGKKLTLKRRIKLFGADILNLCIGNRLVQINVGSEMKQGLHTVCIPNALSPNRYCKQVLTREQERKILNLKQNNPFIVIFGWSPYIKGIDIAVKALDLLYKENSDIRLGIATGTEYTTPKMKEWIKEQTGIAPESSWIKYLDPIEDVFRYYKAADVFLSASRSETFSYAVLESLSIGTPCVISDIDGTRWSSSYPVVRSFQSGNSESCLEIIKDILKLRENKDFTSLSSSVADSVHKEYDIERWLEKVIEQYSI